MDETSVGPLELDILSHLQPRMNLPPSGKYKQSNLLKGMEGERRLYNILRRQLPPCYVIMTNLLLVNDGTEFQIDILLIGEQIIYPLEVKNYEGNFVIQKDSWYTTPSQKEIRNPLHQLKRMEILLENMLKKEPFRFSIEPYIVFVHPEFYLYEAPIDLPLIFPSQIDRFIRKLQSASFHQTTRHKNFVQYLQGRRLSRSSHERLPEYRYEELRKGIVCMECYCMLEILEHRTLICPRCKSKEALGMAIKRNVIEFMTLFPKKKITTNVIHDWCGIPISKKTIRRLLMSLLQPIGMKNHRHYIKRKE